MVPDANGRHGLALCAILGYTACYGPDPTPEYYLTADAGTEPCTNHRMLR